MPAVSPDATCRNVCLLFAIGVAVWRRSRDRFNAGTGHKFVHASSTRHDVSAIDAAFRQSYAR